LALYVALGGVLWIGDYSIGTIKVLIFVLLLISCFRYFTKRENLKGLSFFLLIYSSLVFLMVMNGSELSPLFLWGPLENYMLFVIGYNLSREDRVNNRDIKIAIVIIGFLCFLTVTNFLLGIPNWTSPIELNRIASLNKMTGGSFVASKLYQTGFGLARTGWGNSIAPFVPLAFLLYKECQQQRWMTLLLTISIILSILFCGSRGAVLVTTITIFLFSYKMRYLKFFRYATIIFPIIVLLLWELSFLYEEQLIEYYRLGSGDITTGRSEQYAYIGQMFDRMGMFGLGLNGTYSFLKSVGLPYNIHNAYVNIFLQFGWITGILFAFFVLIVVGYVVREFVKAKDISMICLCLILISGIVSSFYEPMGVWGTRCWYSVWWVALGIFWNKKTISMVWN